MVGIDRKGMRRGAKKVKAASGLGRGGTEKERSRERARANPAGIRHMRRRVQV